MTTAEDLPGKPPLTQAEIVENLLMREMAKARQSGELVHKTKPEPRCRICQDDNTRQLVNRLLAHGLGYTEIIRCLEPVNAKRRRNSQITLNSLRLHAAKHFNLQEPARALYRQILDRRAQENEEDYIQGVGHHVNTLSYLETMMVKGYQELVNEDRNVTVDMGMNAALKLDRLTKDDKGNRHAVEQLNKMNKIIHAVREVVPEQYFALILARLEGMELTSTAIDPDITDAEIEDFDIADESDPRDELA